MFNMKVSVEYETGETGDSDDPAVLPQITGAEYAGSYSVSLIFSDGVVRRVYFGGFLKRSAHPQIRFYLDEREFRKFKIEGGNIVWGDAWDLIFPIEQLYRGEIDG